MRKLSTAFGAALVLSVALAGPAMASTTQECYSPGTPSSVLHDNHETVPAPGDEVVHTSEQEMCQQGL